MAPPPSSRRHEVAKTLGPEKRRLSARRAAREGPLATRSPLSPLLRSPVAERGDSEPASRSIDDLWVSSTLRGTPPRIAARLRDFARRLPRGLAWSRRPGSPPPRPAGKEERGERRERGMGGRPPPSRARQCGRGAWGRDGDLAPKRLEGLLSRRRKGGSKDGSSSSSDDGDATDARASRTRSTRGGGGLLGRWRNRRADRDRPTRRTRAAQGLPEKCRS